MKVAIIYASKRSGGSPQHLMLQATKLTSDLLHLVPDPKQPYLWVRMEIVVASDEITALHLAVPLGDEVVLNTLEV